ncbi:type II toxin-antitoxin system RelB/DinJ family antitoxin [Algibacter mikhailovii]|uniref:Ribbon-helix-helix protein CopG domain-containing protein n=1 Tax=Algibacter mikhailovii TaxID=425498 RepID=A0A918V5V4_9FLAO|nr:type II toxin-antitoxin system RelB/DinJ family antitoxin [Algibacter mikhailovii]GGZ72589.1 hypothetical protein GCM10007028_07020 [Algibacter mikhailovii]
MKKVLNVRIDQELKIEIDRISKEHGMSPSEYVRIILCEYLEYDEMTKTIQTKQSEMTRVIIDIPSDIRKDLPHLVLWLFVNLYSTSYITEGHLNNAKRILSEQIENNTLSNNLRFQFLKVLSDIDRVFAEGIQSSSVMFTKPNNMYTIDYNLIFTEVYSIIDRDYRYEG